MYTKKCIYDKHQLNKIFHYHQQQELCKLLICKLYILAESLQINFKNNYLMEKLNKDYKKIKSFEIIESEEILIEDNNHDELPNIRSTDGHYVRSRGERMIDDYLFNNNIKHIYEKVITINGTSYKPDFYLPDYNCYIEYWGLNNYKYKQLRNKKTKEYKTINMKLIEIENEDIDDIDNFLEKEISKLKG